MAQKAIARQDDAARKAYYGGDKAFSPGATG